MTNSSSTLTDRETLEAELEVTNRICLRQRLNHVINDPNSTINEIKHLVNILSKMTRDHLRTLYPEKELEVEALRLEVRQEAMALRRAKMAATPPAATREEEEATDSGSTEKDPQHAAAKAEQPHNSTPVPSAELAILPQYLHPAVYTAPVVREKSPLKQVRNENPI